MTIFLFEDDIGIVQIEVLDVLDAVKTRSAPKLDHSSMVGNEERKKEDEVCDKQYNAPEDEGFVLHYLEASDETSSGQQSAISRRMVEKSACILGLTSQVKYRLPFWGIMQFCKIPFASRQS